MEAPSASWLLFLDKGGTAGVLLLAVLGLAFAVRTLYQRNEALSESRVLDNQGIIEREIERSAKMIETQNTMSGLLDQQIKLLEKMLARMEADIRARP